MKFATELAREVHSLGSEYTITITILACQQESTRKTYQQQTDTGSNSLDPAPPKGYNC
jgi:hypothetical protein